MICGEDFQGLTEIEKTFKVFSTVLSKKCQNFSIFKGFVFLTFLDLKMTSKFRFDLIRPT